MRRFLHAYWRLRRGLTLGVRGIVIDGDGRILLVKHSYAAGWHLPGGGVEPGETLADALARELIEEGGVVIEAAPSLHGVFFNSEVSRRDHVAVFVVREFRREQPFKRNYEIVDHDFFEPRALPPGTTAGTRRRIAEMLAGGPVSDLW